MKRVSIVRGAMLGLMLAWPALSAAGQWQCDAPARHLIYTDTPQEGRRAGITSGDMDQLRRRFSECTARRPQPGGPDAVTVTLVSGGGNVSESLAMSRFLVDRSKTINITTRVPKGGYCISACTFMFIAGMSRIVESGASFEPHGFSGYMGGMRLAQLVAKLPARIESPQQAKQIIEATFHMNRIELLTGLMGAEQAVRNGSTRLSRDPSWGALSDIFAGTVKRTHAEMVQAGALPATAGADRVLATVRWGLNVIEALRALTPEQLKLLDGVERAISNTIPELERDTVLRHYLGELETDGARRALAQEHARRLVRALAAAESAAYGGSRSMTAAVREDLTAAALEHLDAVRSTRVELFRSLLLPYFQQRAEQDIDLDPFVRLMFSTSILYTRALTREELCDFNIDNSDSCDLLQ